MFFPRLFTQKYRYSFWSTDAIFHLALIIDCSINLDLSNGRKSSLGFFLSSFHSSISFHTIGLISYPNNLLASFPVFSLALSRFFLVLSRSLPVRKAPLFLVNPFTHVQENIRIKSKILQPYIASAAFRFCQRNIYWQCMFFCRLPAERKRFGVEVREKRQSFHTKERKKERKNSVNGKINENKNKWFVKLNDVSKTEKSKIK